VGEANVELFAELLVLLIFCRAFGEAAERLGQTATVGELIAGIVLAAIVGVLGDTIPFLQHMVTSEGVARVAEVGIFFLVLLAGIELKPEEIAEHSKSSFVVAVGGAAVPLAGGFAVAWFYLPDTELKQAQALLVGVAMSITAIPVTVRVLNELGLLHTRLGETIVAAAIFDDVIGLFLLAVLTAVIQTGQLPDLWSLALLLGKVIAFFAIAVALGVHVYPRISETVKTLQAAALEFSALMAVALGYALLAELLDLHWVLGAFVAGLYFEPKRVGDKAYQDMVLVVHGITSGFLAPVFLASIGLRVELDAVIAIPGFLALLIAFAFLGKLIGAGVPAALAGMPKREAAAVGFGMSARGAVELVILGIAANTGLLAMNNQSDDPVVAYLFSALVLMAVVTTLLAPILLRAVLARPDT
jgi:Kef-type K+ transport system membrane component KefB